LVHFIRNYNKVNVRKYSTNNFKIYNVDLSNNLKVILNKLKINPVYTFENLNLENSKKDIKKKLKGLTGIYMIINKITADYYVGSAATDRFYSRFSNHLIYFKGSKIIKSAVKKYNLENFAFLILELYPNIITKKNNKELLDLEDKYLELLLPKYNILAKAGSSFGYKHTEIVKQKMRDNYSDDRRRFIGNLNRGKTLSKETKEKMRKIAFKRPPMTNEIRMKCITQTRPVTIYNLNGTILGKYLTIIDAAKAINCSDKTIRRALKTEKKKLIKKQ
jgi:group I intron endonuclease